MKRSSLHGPIFAYQKYKRYFAQIAEGLEEEGVRELASLGAIDPEPAFRGIYFTAEPAKVCEITYQTRLCSRVLAPLISFDCHSPKYLYKTALKLPWELLLSKSGSFAIAATVANSRIKHSQYAALTLKDALVDSFREKFGSRPDVDRLNPDLQLNLYIEKNRAIISVDISGGSLHRRGYRQNSVKAPVQETLAAAIIRLSGWDGSRPLVDPMCGSGTLLCEALMKEGRVPAGYLRKRFGFENMPDFDRAAWRKTRKEIDLKIKDFSPGMIYGSDISKEAATAARSNLNLLPGGKDVVIKRCAFHDAGQIENAIIVSNPPYGIRLGNREVTADLLKDFGDFLKHNCQGSDAYLYFGRREMLKMIGLKPSLKKPLKNGGLEGVLARYQIY
ncbi:MAG: THUMP domain-containing protein [Thermodesulfobacteriota bacterium]